MPALRGMAWGVALMLASPCLAQIKGEVAPAATGSLVGETHTIDVNLDLTGSGRLLGSYGAVLSWDPAALEYLNDAGGIQPFNSPVVNRLNVSSGILRFSDASPTGASGFVNILTVAFRVIGHPCQTAVMDLEFTSLSEAETFQNLLPLLQVQDATADITDYSFNLTATGQPGTLLAWNPIPGATSYDVIRGGLDLVSIESAFINLGGVTCLENDSLDTTTAAGTESSNPDTLVPLLNRAFFYLVRPGDGSQAGTYGFTPQCARERVVDAGDCPP